jgi:hypothetical protein
MLKTATILFAAGAIGVDAKGKSKSTKCSTPVQYELTVTNTWTDVSHPNNYPSDAHLSPSIAVSHSRDFGMWAPGFKATTGVQTIAESGSPANMQAEIAAASDYVLSSDTLSGGYFFADNSVAETLPETLTLDLSADFSRVSTMHMLAGSPDWFTGISGLDLCDNGKWVDSITVWSGPYDAGTDCGVSYGSANCLEDPQLNVQSITAASTTEGTEGPIFVNDGSVAPVAYWTFSIVGAEDAPKSKGKSKSKAKAMLRR